MPTLELTQRETSWQSPTATTLANALRSCGIQDKGKLSIATWRFDQPALLAVRADATPPNSKGGAQTAAIVKAAPGE